MSLTAAKTSLFPQETNRHRQGRPVVTTNTSMQGEAHTLHRRRRQGNAVTYDDVTQILETNVGDEEEHIDLAMELENLLGSYKRMN